MKRSPIFRLALAGFIAGLYAALTWAIAPYAFGAVQVRISEALAILPALFPEAIPGLSIGCLLANAVSPLGVIDMLVGTTATLIAAVLSYLLRGVKYKGISILTPLPPILVNAVMVGWMIAFFADEGFAWVAFGLNALQVGLGQLIPCYGLGLPLLAILQRRQWDKNNH